MDNDRAVVRDDDAKWVGSVRLTFDGWDGAGIEWLNGRGRQALTAMFRLQDRLTALVDASTPVDLVMTFDLWTTMSRLTGAAPIARFHGELQALGSTARVGDRIVVALDTRWLIAPDPVEPGEYRLNQPAVEMLQRALVREAQHVLMFQRETTARAVAELTGAPGPRFLHQCATRLVDEYRAEKAACLSLGLPAGSPSLGPVLSRVASECSGIAADPEQDGRAAFQRWEDAVNALWSLLTLCAARRASRSQPQWHSDRATEQVWGTYAAPLSRRLHEVLAVAPAPGVLDPHALAAVVDDVTAVLGEYVHQTGCRIVPARSGLTVVAEIYA